jgi:hypothetical protein
MPNTKRPSTTHRTHVFTGTEESWSLIRWLNSAPKKSAGWKRVSEILRIHAAAKARIAALKTHDLMVTIPASYHQTQQIKKLLARYKFRPELMPSARGSHFQWAPVRGEDFSGEEMAILGIMRLADGGLLEKVRECQCGRWFLRKFPNHNHCTAACGDQHRKASDEWRKERKAYRKTWYRNWKNREMKKRGLL